MDNTLMTAPAEQFESDFEHIHTLAEELLPIYSTLLPERAPLNARWSALRFLLRDMHPADLAKILESLPPKERDLVWDLASEDNGEILLEVSDSVREGLIESMDKNELIAAMEDLPADELAELASDLPHHVVDELLETRDAQEQAQIRSAMSYEDGQVGALMDFEQVSIRADVTCEVVLRYLRRFDRLPDHTDKFFVVDDEERLQGVLPIRKLLICDPEQLVEDVMARDVVQFLPTDNTEEAAQAFEKYDLVTAPVIDAEQRLIGRITVDEMVDVIREESETDMLNMAGLREEEDLFAPVLDSVRNRWVWLAVNLCTAFVASRVIGVFSNSIEHIVALAALMPIVAGIGGNSGNQTITMIVRALASGQFSTAQVGYLLKKEMGVAIANGILWGGAMGLIAYALYRSQGLGIVMMTAMTLNLVLAAALGVLIPVMMEKLGKDPALGSSVLITAVTDSGGFFIFLGLASWLLM